MTPVQSLLSDDPELRELVELFVAELPGRAATLQEKFAQADWQALRRAAHQLTGSGGSYGFPQLSVAAGRVERTIVNQRSAAEIGAALDDLLRTCQLLAV